MMMTFTIALKETLAKIRHFNRDLRDQEDGATAVEFALVAMPFFVMILGLLELATIFLTTSTLQNATHEASRQVRTGQFTGTEAEFSQLVCELIDDTNVADCLSRTSVSLKSANNFSQLTSFAPVTPNGTNYNVAGMTVVVKVSYDFPLLLPGNLSQLANGADNKVRKLTVVSAFKNEPF